MTSVSPIKTGRVTGRRTVRYESFAEVLADAERMAAIPTKTLGNWSVGQIYRHLAMAIDAMIDGPPFRLPWPVQWLFRTVLKSRILSRPLPAGFQLPKRAARLVPEPISTEDGLDLLRTAIARIQSTDARGPHGAFGHCTRDEWDQFQFRHCEMHMSFIVPVE